MNTNAPKQEYPKMLYRPGNMLVTQGYGLDHCTVESAEQEKAAQKQGWGSHSSAIQQAKRQQRLRSIGSFVLTHWQFWLSFVVAVLGTIAAFMALR